MINERYKGWPIRMGQWGQPMKCLCDIERCVRRNHVDLSDKNNSIKIISSSCGDIYLLN